MEYQNLPKVSIIMPVRNEAVHIISNLEAILSQDYPQEKIEVIVADGMSDDETRELIKQYINQLKSDKHRQKNNIGNHYPRILLIDNPKKIMPAGANLALRNASGDLVFLMGGHVILPSSYVQKCVKSLLETGADCVGGKLDSIGKGYIGKAVAIAMSSRLGVGNSGFRTSSFTDEPSYTDTVSFCVYRKSVFEKIGFFNEKMVRHQDYDFNYRLRKAGGHILLLPSAVIKYFVRSTIAGLWEQFWHYGVWKGRFVRKHPDSIRFRHLVPPALVILLVLGGSLSIFSPLVMWAFVFTVAAYGAFIFSALIFFLLKGDFKFLPALAIILPSIHLSWGLGFWKGLFMKRLD